MNTSRITDTTGMAVLRDVNGKIIREYDIIKVFHFEGRRRGKGHEKHFMHKIVGIKEFAWGKVWIAYHNPMMEPSEYYVLHGENAYPLENAVLDDTWVVDSCLTLHDKHGG